MTEGYESWWRCGVAEISEKASIQKASQAMKDGIAKARQY